MRYLLVLLLVGSSFGCESTSVTEPTPEAMTPSSQADAPPASASGAMPTTPRTEPSAPAETGPSASEVGSHWGEPVESELAVPPAIVEPGRVRRRMNLDQLENAFQTVSGGLNWTERQGQNEVNLFRSLAATLGKPDYIQTTTEVLEPTALFQKFLDDAARQVCGKMVERDREQPERATLILWEENGQAIEEHLQALILRFHQRDLAQGSADLAQWRWLYDSVVFMTDSRAERWNTVCVALFTHPDFYTY